MIGRLAYGVIGCIALSAALILPAGASANVPIYSLTTTPSSTQAGGHPDVVFTVEVGTIATEPPELPCFCNAVRDLTVNTPAGLIATPLGVPQCTASDFAHKACPVDSQVGIVALRLFAPLEQSGLYAFAPLYNMEAGEGQLALFATVAPFSETPIYTEVSSRTESDYGIEFHSFGIPSILPPNEITQITWGVPADPVHDLLRFPYAARKFEGCANVHGENPLPALTEDRYPENCTGEHLPVPANSSLAPFVQAPTACGGALASSADTRAYDLGTDHADAPFPAITGCDQLSFEPSLSAKPTTTEADAPSGLDVDLTVPQTLSPNTPSPSAIRGVSVGLPPGFTINPNAADGKTACTASEARFGSRGQAVCPEFAKIGTLAVTSSSFPEVLPGAIYLGEPLAGDRYRVFLIFDGFSLHVKLAGTATPDPLTGRLTVSFHELPQFNFQEFDLHLFGAERGLLATPTQCGTYPVKATFEPWASPDVPVQTSTQFFTIDIGPAGSPCPPPARPFAPSFIAGVADNTAAAHSPFSLHLIRPDGDQDLTGLQLVTPPGWTASLKGIPYCPESAIAHIDQLSYLGLAEQAAPACPSASQVGTVVAGAGAGTRPLYVPGRVFLAGPYKGAPISLEVVIPAVSGPYDLGVVAVRAAVRIDPTTAQVTTVSDPLPQLIEGIPLRTRSIQIDLDRDGFALNPTDCDPFAVSADILGDQGASVARSSHFQVANCADLPYTPKLSLKLRGGVRRLGHPAIHAVFASKPGEANASRVSVTLPRGELLDNDHFRNICTRVAFAARACPAGSAIGKAEAITPLLDRPLAGSVYLRSSSHDLPDIAVDLRGQVDFVLSARVDSVKGRLRTTFESVPDVPVSRFILDLAGGKKGLLQNTETLCGATKRASARLRGQNGAALKARIKLQVACGASHRSRNRHHSGTARRGRS